MKSGYWYGFWHLTELWVFPANGVGGCQNLWVFTVYGLSERWVMTESTVVRENHLSRFDRFDQLGPNGV